MRPLLRSASGQLNHGQEYALVFIRQEGRWQADKQHRHADNDQQIDNQVAPGAAQDPADAVGVMVNALVKPGVKPAEEPLLP